MSELRSRVIRGAAGWKPLQVAKLGAAPARKAAGAADTAAANAAAQLEARIAAAFEEGVAEGLYRARTEQQDRERQLGLSAQQRWDGLLDGLAQGIGEIEGRLADRLLDVAAMLAASMACREITIARDRIEPVLAEALALVGNTCRQLEVTAHPSDCEAIDAWLRSQCGESTLAIRADATIAPGGCLLRADDATLDATLQTRIRRTLASVGIVGGQAESAVAAAMVPQASTSGSTNEPPEIPRDDAPDGGAGTA